MSYRPITDVMILARSKTKYYGAFPAGFLSRARNLLGVGPKDAVLHVCGGKVRDYPFKGLGVNDRTLDLDPACQPDFLQDANDPLPLRYLGLKDRWHGDTEELLLPWAAVLIDRPYSIDDAKHYAPGPDVLPDLNKVLRNALAVVPIGHRVGVLDYLWPHPGKHGVEVAVLAVGTGRNARARWFTVFERIAP
jgi:hypothetical protein